MADHAPPDRNGHHASAAGPGTQRTTAPGAAAVAAYAALAGIVLNEQPLGEVLHKVAALARDTVPGADEVSVTLIERGRPTSVSFTGDLAVALDERQYQDGFGPCLDAARTGQVIRIEDTAHCLAYPDFAALARQKGIQQTLSVNVPTHQGVLAALNVYGSGGSFDSTVQDIVVSFAGYAAIALLNAALYAGAVAETAQLRQAMRSRAGIEQAKGILMRDRHCTADEAFDVLRKISADSNRKVRDVAQVVIENAAR